MDQCLMPRVAIHNDCYPSVKPALHTCDTAADG